MFWVRSQMIKSGRENQPSRNHYRMIFTFNNSPLHRNTRPPFFSGWLQFQYINLIKTYFHATEHTGIYQILDTHAKAVLIDFNTKFTQPGKELYYTSSPIDFSKPTSAVFI